MTQAILLGIAAAALLLIPLVMHYASEQKRQEERAARREHYRALDREWKASVKRDEPDPPANG